LIHKRAGRNFGYSKWIPCEEGESSFAGILHEHFFRFLAYEFLKNILLVAGSRANRYLIGPKWDGNTRVGTTEFD
jgi:hypothetical protein